MEQWFEGRVALVTGGADGIGRETALLLARRGAKLVVSDIDVAKGEAVVRAIRDSGGEAVLASGDVTNRADVAKFVEAALDSFGRLDCAFNNAGITNFNDNNWDDDAFDRTIDVNLKGIMNCMKVEIPAMLKSGGGAIVNNASVSSFVASATLPMPGYTSSKHGVIGLTKAAAIQYSRQNIRINAICPGVTDTEMVREAKEISGEARHALDNFAPMGRMARPAEIAEAAVWLCSDKASFVTAHSLVVDGGFLAT
jgi:NAD(P)-dependent dehydrogenase (short-subunit alcohol dehydrogenase family)